MKRVAWLGSLVVVVAFASVGCALQVDGQGQDGSYGNTSQSLGTPGNGVQNDNGRGDSTDNGNGALKTTDPGKPTPDPWRTVISPAKPTPDPWRPGGVGAGSSNSDGNQTGTDPSSTTQTGAAQNSAR